MKHQTIAILGVGNMGTALAKVIAENGHNVNVWNYEGDIEPLQQIQELRENKKYLPGVKLPKNICVCFDIEKAVQSAEAIFLVVSSGAIESVLSRAEPFLEKKSIVVDVSKGFHPKNGELIPMTMKKMLKKKNPIVSLSGPAIAGQIAEKQPAAMVAASDSPKASELVKNILQNGYIKIIPGKDVVGVEVMQTLKNVYAIGMGIAQGIPLELNTRSILFTLAFEEMKQMTQAMGGKIETVYGYAGLGDFVTTAFSAEGRNRQFGECLGQGLNQRDAIEKVKQTVEGISAAKVLKKLAKKYNKKLLFAETILQVIEGKEKAKEAFEKLFKKIK